MLLLGAGHVYYYAPFLSDDALISLRYAERLFSGHGLTWTGTERVEGYTDLAWVLLTALLGALGVDLIVAARGLGIFGATLALMVTALVPERPARLAWPRLISGSLLLALSGPLAVWAIGALEHGFQAGVLVGTAWLLMRLPPAVAPRGWERAALAVALVLLVWLRADGAVLIAGLLAGSWLREFSRASLWHALKWALVPLGAFGLQLLFRRLYYDAWVPNTALVKVTGFSAARLALGVAHLRMWAEYAWPLLVVTGLALVPQLVRRRPRAYLVPLVASLSWFAYLVAVGGDIFPAWRQVLLGFAPLGLVIAEGAELVWNRFSVYQPKVRLWARAGMVAGIAALAATYAYAQFADPQNKRGRDERWEFDGFSLGPLMRTAWSDRQPLLAVDAAGALPYFSKLPSLDMLGLNDRYIATHPPALGSAIATGHEFGDGAYVWSRKPDILSMCGAAGAKDPCFLSGRQLFAHREFHAYYQLMRYHSVEHHSLTGDLWIRREDGVLGVERSATRLVVPGWLLAESSGVAEIHEGRLKTTVTPHAPGHLRKLRVPAGKWRVSAEAGGAVLKFGALCEGRALRRTTLAGLVLETVREAHVDLLVGADQPAFVERLTLEHTVEPASAWCDPAAPAAQKIDVSQLATRAPEGGYFLQPHGFKLDGQPLVVHLPAGHALRYELGADANDTYVLRFLMGAGVLGEQEVPSRAAGGLGLSVVDVPAGADSMEVTVRGGDGLAALSHFVPLVP